MTDSSNKVGVQCYGGQLHNGFMQSAVDSLTSFRFLRTGLGVANLPTHPSGGGSGGVSIIWIVAALPMVLVRRSLKKKKKKQKKSCHCQWNDLAF